MIKVKITKNIIRKTQNSLGLSMRQIVVAGCAVVLGIILYFSLQNVMPSDILMTLIFIVLGVIICCGCLNIQGMSVFEYLIKIFKGVDMRPYKSKGVFSEDAGISDKEEK